MIANGHSEGRHKLVLQIDSKVHLMVVVRVEEDVDVIRNQLWGACRVDTRWIDGDLCLRMHNCVEAHEKRSHKKVNRLMFGVFMSIL